MIGAAAASCLDDQVSACPAPRHRSRIITSRASYAVAASLVFLVEVAIAACVHDAVVRPYLGDSLAVVLVYLAIRAVTPFAMRWSAAAALAVACAIEVGQWFHLADLLGLGHVRIARIVIGTGFDPADFLAYAGGAVAVVAVETARRWR